MSRPSSNSRKGRGPRKRRIIDLAAKIDLSNFILFSACSNEIPGTDHPAPQTSCVRRMVANDRVGGSLLVLLAALVPANGKQKVVVFSIEGAGQSLHAARSSWAARRRSRRSVSRHTRAQPRFIEALDNGRGRNHSEGRDEERATHRRMKPRLSRKSLIRLMTHDAIALTVRLRMYASS
jgi:hypothetical protein